jgi:hypothetical protein
MRRVDEPKTPKGFQERHCGIHVVHKYPAKDLDWNEHQHVGQEEGPFQGIKGGKLPATFGKPFAHEYQISIVMEHFRDVSEETER